MQKLVTVVALALAFLLVVPACAPKQEAVRTPGIAPAESGAASSAKPAWQQDWERTVAASKQEGVVSIYTPAGAAQNGPIRDGFMRAYGIDIEYISGKGAALRERLTRERRAGLYLVDIFFGGASSFITDLMPEGVFEPLKPQLVLPEVLDPTVWYGGNHMYIDREGSYVIALSYSPRWDVAVNTDLVKPDDIRTNKDLLNPKWKGKIVMDDPAISGTGQRWFQMTSRALGYDFMREFVKQEPQLTRDLRQPVEWVARGKYSVVVGASAAIVAEFMGAGAPVRYIETSDVVSAGSFHPMGLMNKAPHPNAAKVYINWLLTREGQTVHSKAYAMQSSRLDVPTDGLPPEMVRRPGVTYLNGDSEEILLDRPAAEKEAQRIFGALLK
ncbi:MAG: extracellular solute-binding protein [Chloroflexi bacterium]|nr:extracellular solute-binding protein [Chloroflexota bacterium]